MAEYQKHPSGLSSFQRDKLTLTGLGTHGTQLPRGQRHHDGRYNRLNNVIYAVTSLALNLHFKLSQARISRLLQEKVSRVRRQELKPQQLQLIKVWDNCPFMAILPLI